ncbi:hypothetical protein LO771_28265 [Streptacidiphilus sp. ASG 303]|uniref:hypothetical protein n=1 Tax=Streptacidiphilus sp. ASG 303 TaxID=2896847 RepID=UPI001E48C34A|nr:hypothetical protein [Streptacidiphilus sp. ASG 303]MCD0486173.1 hypothetical protein [Streptacidiphilus sp. ASG 303]
MPTEGQRRGESGLAGSGQFTAEINSSASPAHQNFAQVLRDLWDVITRGGETLSHRALQERLRKEGMVVSATRFSELLSARRPPDLNLARKLLEYALEASGTDTASTQSIISRSELEALHERAAVKHCACCPDGKPSSSHLPGEPLSPEVTSAALGAEVTNGTTSRRSDVQPAEEVFTSDSSASTAAGVGLPVPAGAGDRQPDTGQEAVWPPLSTLEHHLRDKRFDDARVILRYAGTDGSISEIPDAVSACRGAGLDLAAETIFHYVAQRESRDVLRVLQLLASEQRYADVDTLLQAANGDHVPGAA